MTKMNKDFYDKLDYYIPNVRCELNYTKDYELLIATVLSAQCTDKRVNEVTKVLFSKYDLSSLASAKKEDIEKIIRSCGSYTKKTSYIINIANSLINDQKGIVPNDRSYIESLSGAGRKTCNVVLKNLYNVPCIPVDTHVERVSKRLGFAKENATPLEVEHQLMNLIPMDKWNKVSEQLLLFGRYYCKSQKPNCENCLFKNECKKKQ
jgi:endonuclease-3